MSVPVIERSGAGFETLGRAVLELVDRCGRFGLLAVAVLRAATRPRFPWRATLQQFEAIGARACAERASDRDLQRLERRLGQLATAFARGESRAILGATTDFYETMFLSGGKTEAWSILKSLNARVTSLRRMTVTSQGRAEDSLNEMRVILECLLSRDPARAEAACRDHVRKAAAVATAIFRSSA